ncbi:hypothetical protein M0R45_025786 [Rubus argutus]|uniref:Pre-mRNA splicing factor component Cdc5p/Cef1 C-terminal domain-containing protein n=1 Tax=Rubus argutus TaxID=59490 RepID=A0AAW1WWC4_RUBAR
MLPAPQISDHELEEIAEMGCANDLAGSELTEGSGATRALLAHYAQTPRLRMTPLRTPQRTSAGKGDAIMMEASNLAMLRESQTPLLGGENPQLYPSDFSGVTPRKKEIQTPNLMLFFQLLECNTGHHRQFELGLALGFKQVTTAQNEYQILMQPVPEDNGKPEEKIEVDMSDRIARERAEEEARQQALLRKRSKVLQRELPRPPAPSVESLRKLLSRADEDKSKVVPPA